MISDDEGFMPEPSKNVARYKALFGGRDILKHPLLFTCKSLQELATNAPKMITHVRVFRRPHTHTHTTFSTINA
jgi:hypothetical protein